MPVLAEAAGNYWLNVFPDACREVRTWRTLAGEIPDLALRRIALEAHCDKRGNLEGATAFAAFAQPGARHAVVRALVAYQAIFDYLDNLSEQPCSDPIANGRQLNSALLAAVAPDEPPIDYYAHRQHDGDGGYLAALIATCHTALTALPSFAAIAELLQRATERVVVYQSLNHGDSDGRHDAFERWARETSKPYARLRWWEVGAASGSTLDLFALIAAAADPALEPDDAERLRTAYFPWVGALHSLLDSLADCEEDTVTGKRGLIDYYSSPAEAADRIATIATEAMHRTKASPEGRKHALILAAMTSFYLCDLSMSSSPYARLTAPTVLDAMGGLARPTMLIVSARRSASRMTDRLTRRLSARQASQRAAQQDRRRMLESIRHQS